MSSDPASSLGVAELLRRPSAHKAVRAELMLEGLAISTARVPEGAMVGIDLDVTSTGSALVVTGTVAVPWEGQCRRCLELVTGVAEVEVREIFEHGSTEGETYPLGEDSIDLEPMVRDAALLALPLAPLCDAGCLGPAPGEFPTGSASYEAGAGDDGPSGPGDPATGGGQRRDPRWSALDALRFGDEHDDGAPPG